MIQRRTTHILTTIRHQIVRHTLNRPPHPLLLQLLLGYRHHQKFEQMPLTGHSLVEILLEFSSLEEAGRQGTITVPQHSRHFNVTLHFPVRFKPDSRKLLTRAQVHISGPRQRKQTMRPATG